MRWIIVVALLLPAFAPAGAQEARLRERLDPTTAGRVGAILDSARVSGLPTRPLVSKALAHLDNVGATVAGLVFNRAQAADFERSVSGMNLRNGTSRMSNVGRGTLAGTSVLGQN